MASDGQDMCPAGPWKGLCFWFSLFKNRDTDLLRPHIALCILSWGTPTIPWNPNLMNTGPPDRWDCPTQAFGLGGERERIFLTDEFLGCGTQFRPGAS